MPPSVTNDPVVFVAGPGDAEVTCATIVQLADRAMTLPDAMVIVDAVLVTPGQLPLMVPTMVMPLGIVSVNGAVNVSGAAFGFDSVSVNVDVPPRMITVGANALVNAGTAALTVNGALAAGAVPASVASATVVLVTVPGVNEVSVAMIVHPVVPGTVLPDAIVIVVVVLVTPVHVPLVAPTIVTPLGMVSVNGAVSVSGVAFGLPNVSVSVALPPDVIVGGAIVFASVGAAAFTVAARSPPAPCPPP